MAAPVIIEPEASVFVHALTGIDLVALNLLQGEDFQLVHSLRVAATRQTFREINSGGACFLRVDFDPVLRWTVSAEVLSHQKLSNWHPGRSLTKDEVEFFNGQFVPFAFAEDVRTSIYEEPVLEMRAGDLSEITYSVVDEFSDYDEAKLVWTGSEGLVASIPELIPDIPPGGPGGGGGGGYWG